MIEKQKSQTADSQEPDFLETTAGDGLDVFGTKDLSIPFIWILQKGNPQVEEQNPAYVEGAKPGMFINGFTKKLYPSPLKVIPLWYETPWLVYENVDGQKGTFKGKKTPGSIKIFGSPFDEGGTKDIDGNIVVEAMAYYVLLVGEMEAGPAVISLKGSDIPHAKDWNTSINNTVLKSGKKASFYSSVWDLTLQYNSATKNGKEVSWYALGVKGTTAIKRDRYMTKEEFISFVQPNRDMIISGQKKADFLLEGGQQQAQLPAPSDIPF